MGFCLAAPSISVLLITLLHCSNTQHLLDYHERWLQNLPSDDENIGEKNRQKCLGKKKRKKERNSSRETSHRNVEKHVLFASAVFTSCSHKATTDAMAG